MEKLFGKRKVEGGSRANVKLGESFFSRRRKKKTEKSAEGASGPCGPGEFPVPEQGSVPNSQTAGPYSLGKSVFPHEPIDPTSPGQRSPSQLPPCSAPPSFS